MTIRYLPVSGLFTSFGGRTTVHSVLLRRISSSIAARSAYTSRAKTLINGSRIRRLTKLSPSGTGPTGTALTATKRRTPVASIARRIPRVAVEATGPSLRPRGPTPEIAASLPSSAGRSVSGSVRPGTATTSSAGWFTSNRAGSRTTAVTLCPASSACRTTSPPMRPVAPKTVTFICCLPVELVPARPHPRSLPGCIMLRISEDMKRILYDFHMINDLAKNLDVARRRRQLRHAIAGGLCVALWRLAGRDRAGSLRGRGGCSRRGAGGSEQAAADQPAGRGGGATGGAWGAGRHRPRGTARADTPAVHAGLTADHHYPACPAGGQDPRRPRRGGGCTRRAVVVPDPRAGPAGWSGSGGPADACRDHPDPRAGLPSGPGGRAWAGLGNERPWQAGPAGGRRQCTPDRDRLAGRAVCRLADGARLGGVGGGRGGGVGAQRPGGVTDAAWRTRGARAGADRPDQRAGHRGDTACQPRRRRAGACGGRRRRVGPGGSRGTAGRRPGFLRPRPGRSPQRSAAWQLHGRAVGVRVRPPVGRGIRRAVVVHLRQRRTAAG